VLDLAQRFGGYAGLAMVGTAWQIADEMEAWLVGRGSDGFNVLFSDLPAGLVRTEAEPILDALRSLSSRRNDARGTAAVA
jgi:alkanesulfonate monooxygenase SsuD/methylene tetrahydromethanopterin reductase-like flavin-dependent oxidoreductase (luciferase family)